MSVMKPPARCRCLLHLVEGFGKGVLQPERLLNLVGRYVRIFPIFEKARAVMVPNKLDEGWHIRLPVLRKSFQVLEDRVDSALRKQSDCVIRVLVEFRVKD